MRTIELYTGEFCQPCKMLKGVLDSKGIPYIVKDLEENPDIKSVPTVYYMEDGVKIDETIGASGAVVAKIADWLNG